MKNVYKVAAAIGTVAGPFCKEYLVCQNVHMTTSKGLFFGSNVLDYSAPVLMAQIVLIFFASRLTYCLLKPLRQSLFTAQVVAGIIIGPTILGSFSSFMPRLFPPEGKINLQVFANIGFMFHLFVLGIQMDAGILRRAGTRSVLIGFMCFATPCAVGGLTFFIIKHWMTLDETLAASLPFIVAVNSMTCFPNITTFLSDLNILNSELGRIVTYSSMISDSCSLLLSAIVTTLGVAARDSKWMTIWSLLWMFIFLLSIVFIIRPFIIWLTRHTPEGQPMREFDFTAITMLVLVCGLCTEVLGQHSALGPFMLGIALPDGPPLGVTLVQKFDAMATGFLLPVFIAVSGLQTNLLDAVGRYSLIIELIIIIGYVAKFAGTLLAALFCKVPLYDAIILSLMMCCKGVIEIAIYNMWKDSKILDDRSFSLLLLTMLVVLVILRPTIQFLYDPSSRYTTDERRSIVQSEKENDIHLRVLVCVHNDDNVPTIINLLETFNPTRLNPLSVFVLHLMELNGRASSSVLVSNHYLKKVTSSAIRFRSEQIVNAFKFYEQLRKGNAIVQHFTAIAPHASMHNDVCTLALDKRTSIVIVPFHKQWAIHKSGRSSNSSIRTVNCNVLKKAPCSVGILIDRSHIRGNRSIVTGHTPYHIALFYFGGSDDWEALAFGRRMAEHPNIRLSVVWFKHATKDRLRETGIDDTMIDEFRENEEKKDKNRCIEKVVVDGEETTQVIRAFEDICDLVIVGRHHSPNLPSLSGLTMEWSECPELGVIGDMLASSDFQFSVLVVQQQPQGAELYSIPSLPISGRLSVDSRAAADSSTDENR